MPPLIILFTIIACVCVILGILFAISFWKIYVKAGKPGWSVFIPFYRIVKLLELTHEPLWWVIPLCFVPILNIILYIVVLRRLASVFGKGIGFTVGLVLLPFIFYPIIAFGKSQYVNTFPPSAEMSEAVRWTLIAGGLFFVSISLYLIALFSLGVSTMTRPAPLTVISAEFGYATDGNYVYMNDTPIYGADPSSFRVEGDYAVDAHSVYYDGQVMTNVKPSTFTVLSSGSYAESGTTVYYEDSPIQGADASTFVDLGQDYAKDANNVYFSGNVVEGADPASFVIDDDPNGNFDAEDNSHHYLQGEVVTK